MDYELNKNTYLTMIDPHGLHYTEHFEKGDVFRLIGRIGGSNYVVLRGESFEDAAFIPADRLKTDFILVEKEPLFEGEF